MLCPSAFHFRCTLGFERCDESGIPGSYMLLPDEKSPIGIIIDKSSHVKKGDKLVGVGKQYCGTKGKIENCQMSVYVAFSTKQY